MITDPRGREQETPAVLHVLSGGSVVVLLDPDWLLSRLIQRWKIFSRLFIHLMLDLFGRRL